ncbi:MAG: hypothetical protein J3R72DRAFT_429250 [Linnemannia gamsii]|nr:MAG: hypothetical protein J3R72DRAFT_429250 [Linnemannia gamsii]
MKYRFCYPLLVPIRLFITLLTLSNIICILVGKQLSKDTPPPSAPSDAATVSTNPQLNYDGTAATDMFFPDSEQTALNACLLAATLYMLYKPQTRFWWLTSNFRLTILSWGFAILGGYYAVTQYIRIVPVNGGCETAFFRYTRMQCWMQVGVSAGQVGWAILLIWESFVMVKQKNDHKWNERRVDEEIQSAVMYQPDLTALPSGSGAAAGVRDSFDYDGRSLDELDMATGTGIGVGAGIGAGARQESDAIELGYLGRRRDESSGTTTTGAATVDEELPEYASRRLRNQPLIVDTTHPPRRLAGAVARRMQSESATHTMNAPSAPPSESASQEQPTTLSIAAATPTAILPPPPCYTP